MKQITGYRVITSSGVMPVVDREVHVDKQQTKPVNKEVKKNTRIETILPTIFFSLLRKAVIVIPLTIWLPTVGNLGTTGVFLAEPISNFIGGTACFVTMMFTVWRKLDA